MKQTICQSCGMPLSRDEQGGGTNADGSKSTEYCSHCYQNGTWMMDMTVDQMQERVGAVLKQHGASKTIQKIAMAGVPTLSRWSK